MTLEVNIKSDTYNGTTLFDEYPFILSDFQKHAIDAINNNNNVLVTALTGSGKTLIAEHLINKCHNLDSSINKRKVIYTTPIKALSNCLFNDFTNKFPNISFGILTGDIKYNPDADCVIMTTEILRNLLYNKKIKTQKIGLDIEIDVYNDVAAVIFDEIHYISDKHRGRVWEESLILLPPNIQILMLSATIDRPHDFAKWLLDIKQVPITLASCYKRVVPLKHYVYLSFIPKLEKVKKTAKNEQMIDIYKNNLTEILNERNTFNTIHYDKAVSIQTTYSKYMSKKAIFNDITKFLKNELLVPAILFTLSRKKCVEYAKHINISLNNVQEQILASKVFDSHLRKSDNYNDIIKMEEYFRLKDLITKGIAYHHSGVYHIFKEVIEIMFGNKTGNSKPLIKLLFATETFAVGVNMPTKAVCYTGLTKFSDGNFRLLYPHEYRQMSGRAGRRGMDSEGIVILMPNLYELPTVNVMKTIMTGKNQTLQSRFIPNFQFLLKLILTGNKQILIFVKNSLLNKEIVNSSNLIESELNKITIPEFDYEDCIEYERLSNFNANSFIRIPQKIIKKNKKKAYKIRNTDGFEDKYNKYLSGKKIMEKKVSLTNELENNNIYIHNTIIKVLTFLQNNNYILNSTNIQDYENILPRHISIKGIIASQINECNEILFTEIICQEYLDNLNAIEITTLLAIFLETKVKDNINSLSNIDLPANLINSISNINDLKETILYDIDTQYLYLDSNWEISYNMLMPTYSWITGKNINYILKTYDLYPGSFVKDMIKLNNLVQDVIKVAEVLNKVELMSNASKIESLLIRDTVSLESLYVKI